MIKYTTRFFITFLLAVIAFGANAQSTATTSSPYSRFGIGDLYPSTLPQNQAMGGIATAINRLSGYNNINPLNPASYGFVNFTTIDIGLYSNITNSSQNITTNGVNSTATDKNVNFRLSHVAFAVPVTKRSALSFGLLPYTQLGYNYKTSQTGSGSGSKADSNVTNYIYSGQGGLSKAYLGYGIGITKHLYIGGNISYIFGNLIEQSSTEIPALYGTLNSRIEQSNSIGGLNYDYGLQYSLDLTETKHLVFGYSASASSNLSNKTSYIVSQYTRSSSGSENVATDSLINSQKSNGNVHLPQVNHFGIAFQNDGHILVGADYTTGKWSNLSIAGVNSGLHDSKEFNIGAAYTPNINALRNYFSRIDYRVGFLYNQTALNVTSTTDNSTSNIKARAVTVGLGLPLAPNNGSFYKINIGAELGQRGMLAHGLVKENYVNLHLSFTLNDKWFQRYKFD